ncbi:inner membrane-spanning protein YciB [Actibacterium lipolyticum]|uniref:Inner membrane-spanning protein YciB n=1 Tax=Actibacterium lipolyticum TaxID=1524263 RepID=A0A238KKK1_9RHOB|nr:inner membrane-spanning protein YciB [Actibacterium lipolyticum]SMX43329.1 Intracellular septation protein [Actibacterium lipolyticum]
MAEKQINPFVRLGLEIGPIVAFFVAYVKLKGQTFTIGGTDYDGFILVTAGFIPLILLSTFLMWKLSGHISKMQIVTAVLVVVFGGLTVWLNDDRFIKMKPTMIYTLFAGILGFGLLRGESYLKYVMEGMMPLQHEGWLILTRRLMFFFALLAILNEVIWRTMSTDAWVNFKTFGLTVAIFVFFMTQNGLFQKYAIEEKNG